MEGRNRQRKDRRKADENSLTEENVEVFNLRQGEVYMLARVYYYSWDFPSVSRSEDYVASMSCGPQMLHGVESSQIHGRPIKNANKSRAIWHDKA